LLRSGQKPLSWTARHPYEIRKANWRGAPVLKLRKTDFSIRHPLRCDNVILPRSGLIADDRLHPRQANALACVHDANTDVGRKVWLSRSALPAQFGRIENEEQVESILEARGWTVVRSETMRVAA
jgi:hypothetical protein